MNYAIEAMVAEARRNGLLDPLAYFALKVSDTPYAKMCGDGCHFFRSGAEDESQYRQLRSYRYECFCSWWAPKLDRVVKKLRKVRGD